MSSLLSSHLDQIALCASSIADLPFPGPKPFTNALLAHHDITTLIRDTEAHERALFSIAPPPLPNLSSSLTASTQASHLNRTAAAANARPPRHHTAVAAVLGGDLYKKTRAGYDVNAAGRFGEPRAADRRDVDVEVLLQGAEKLCRVYPVPGASERIARLRSRYTQLAANIAHYEGRVAAQAAQLDEMQQSREHELSEDAVDIEQLDEPAHPATPSAAKLRMTRDDFEAEEQEIRQLERKKRALEDRVTGMEKDIGGLMR